MSTTKITGTGLGLPTADGAALGGASNEFSDLYLADGSVIYFGADQEVKVTHVADTGLTLKHTATADDKPISLTLQTGETDMAADDVMGKIAFQAPDEGTGTDAILVSAAIQARAEGDFSSSSNATSLDFMTGSSEAAAKKWTIKSDGKFEAAGAYTIDMNAGELILDADADTSITASTDDQIDIRIAGADDFTFTANTFTAASGSGVVIPDSGLTLGSTAVTSTAAELNTLDALSRGSVLYGNASAVTTVLTKGTANQVLTSDGTDLSWADASGAITALNSATANELVTVGSTTTELDAETNLTYDGSTLAVTGDVDITSGSILFKTASEGIYLGVTSQTASNFLDDYEEGTFTPTLVAAGGSGTISYGGQLGRYIKIGKNVYISIRLYTTGISSTSGNIHIAGLPYTAHAVNSAEASCGWGSGLNITAGYVVHGRVTNGGSVVWLTMWNLAAGTSYMQMSEWSSNGDIALNVTYEAA